MCCTVLVLLCIPQGQIEFMPSQVLFPNLLFNPSSQHETLLITPETSFNFFTKAPHNVNC